MNWKDIVKKVAPTLGTAIGGPFGGIAAKFIASKFLGKDDATEDEIADAIIGSSPEQLVKLRELDSQFKLEMRRLGIREDELAVEDRKSARELARGNMVPHIVLSAIYTAAYGAVLYAFVTGGVDIAEDTRPELNIVLGVLTAAQTQIMNFWFGSSSGSKHKDTNRTGQEQTK